ncbi:MAG: hypothetical protein OEZ43_07610 [Gammaproteobacteria bacterium]|nr:hypothetical protein [Gammaproteobacteria bacterium]
MGQTNSLNQFQDISRLLSKTLQRHLGLVVKQSDRDIGTLMKVFQELLSKLQQSDTDSSTTADVMAILEALQFHDRITQILTSSQKSLEVYLQALDELKNGQDIDVASLEKEIRSHFVVAEQYADDDPENKPVDSDKPIFF